MSFSASADLVYGVLVNAGYDGYENYTPHPLWDTDEQDWRDFESNDYIELHRFGHYENADEQKVIVRVKALPVYSADCWEPAGGFNMLLGARMTALADAQSEAERQGYGLSFHEDAKWWLVASYG